MCIGRSTRNGRWLLHRRRRPLNERQTHNFVMKDSIDGRDGPRPSGAAAAAVRTIPPKRTDRGSAAVSRVLFLSASINLSAFRVTVALTLTFFGNWDY